MDITHLLNKPLPAIPDDIRHAIDSAEITLTPFGRKDEILCSTSLQEEVGYRKDEEGNYLVSMVCPMPGITSEMIQWWFWWHAQESIRYQIWFPGAHITNSYPKKQKTYFEQASCPPFQNNTQYPRETIGGMTTTLQIDFVTPEEFGFSKRAMEENGIATIVCGHVGLKGLFMHTEMAHMFRQTEGGLQMFSRFWMGNPIRNRWLRSKIMTDKMAKGMAEHCCIEYRNLAAILPDLYEKFA